MATKSGPSKKAQRSKSKSRPVGTTALSEPLIAEASSAASFTAFSPSGLLFAHVALAVDKHRLRIFDTESGKAVAETVFQNSRVSAIHWTQQSSGGGATPGEGESIESANNDDARRKRAKRKSVSGATVEHVLAIGFMNGTVAIFSPRQGEITKTFSSSTISSSILSITSPLSASDSSSVSSLPASLWTSSSNGQVCAWDLQSGKLLTTLRTKNAASQYTAIAVRSSGTTPSSSHLLAAHHRIQLFGASQSAEPSSSSPEYASFTGHASPVFALQWASSPVSPHSSSSSPQQKLSFISAAEGDRFACIWQVPDIEDDEDYDSDDDEAAPEGVLAASIPLDTDVRAVAYSSSSAGGQFALALSASGALRIFVPPTAPNVSSKGKGVEPVTSVAGTTVSSIPSSPPIVSAAFDPQSAGMVRVARLVNGVRPVFERVEFLGKDQSFVPDAKLKAPAVDSLEDGTSDKVLATKRYKEGNGVAIRTGAESLATADTDAAHDGNLDASLAELSLGQRLAARAGPPGATIDHQATTADEQGSSQAHFILKADAPTLTRTLTQALHSNDTPLLESVLANSSKPLISGTVSRLQPQYALPLIMACVERMNRGARAGRGKGRGGGASAQRAQLMVRWIRAVLVAHTAHLMTVPDLVARLSALHTTVVQRTALQDRLLALNGRLDLVLAQMEYRASIPKPAVTAAAKPEQAKQTKAQSAAARKRRAKKARKRAQGAKYVEGESTDEEAEAEKQAAMQVDGEEEDEDDDSEDDDEEAEAQETDEELEIDDGSDEGSIEDIELGAEDLELGSDDDDDFEDDDEDDEDGEGKTNGLLDLEVESSDDDDEEDDDEDD